MKNKMTMFTLKVVRKLYSIIVNSSVSTPIYEGYIGKWNEDANGYIYSKLIEDKPIMISKFGTIELNALVSHKMKMQENYSVADLIAFITGKIPNLWWPIKLDALCTNAGFFPNEKKLLAEFYRVNSNAAKEIDILGSYIEKECYLKEFIIDAVKVNLDGYYAPFLYEKPWTKALEGKKVLVIHPFVEEIKSQYARKKLIWKDPNILPDFELLTYKPVVSMLGQQTKYNNWFDALIQMEDDISKLDFDVAIIGCGAYGMPLSAFVKNMGKKSIHLAGWTQVLFGIKGKRWDDLPHISRFYTSAWIRPNSTSRPEGMIAIEKGCYW
ncbi:hypothetical protein ACMYSL_10100 [Klebsiella sp. MISC125]|uniref:hypothetical protein n=1 Tax=Klebsiella sp. MISC125 TaxID=2755386 RepID=UPI003DA92DE7